MVMNGGFLYVYFEMKLGGKSYLFTLKLSKSMTLSLSTESGGKILLPTSLLVQEIFF